ncbi:MAG TPA: thioredoxin [Pyrodictiaceae archaeon]|nr:thioredoxin [Pyrodictiaceae archaeon]HIP85212.1 thioredoxin [Pyrodictium sp.]HIQ10703.1 thioredoxin [Pyrodictium sp.]HIQ56019.1 thioredoxin [Pyrodictium sp.]
MPFKPSSIQEFENMLKKKRVVLALYYREKEHHSIYIRRLAESLKSNIEPSIPILLVDVDRLEEVCNRYGVASVPRLQLFLDGNVVWEQLGVLGTISADKEAIRFGIRESLRKQGYSLKDLGIRVYF